MYTQLQDPLNITSAPIFFNAPLVKVCDRKWNVFFFQSFCWDNRRDNAEWISDLLPD